MKKLFIILFIFTFNQVTYGSEENTGSNAEHRTVSAGGSITEIMYALGLGNEIIAVDTSSYFPPEAAQKISLGYFRRLSAEGVLSTNPTRVVAANGAGPDDVLSQIKNAGVEVKVFKQEKYNLATWKAYIKEIGVYFNKIKQADHIVSHVENQLNLIDRKKNTTSQSAIFLMDLGERGPVAAGLNTMPDMLFGLAGYENVVTDFEGFKPFSPESLIKIKPDLIVIPSHVMEKLGGQQKVCSDVVISMATADKGCDIFVMDALLALGFGTRIGDAVEALVGYEK